MASTASVGRRMASMPPALCSEVAGGVEVGCWANRPTGPSGPGEGRGFSLLFLTFAFIVLLTFLFICFTVLFIFLHYFRLIKKQTNI